jgi:hypothetical protein
MNWSRALKQELSKGRHFPFEPNEVMCALYRPYHKSWLYFDRKFNEFVYQMPKIFPSPKHKNIVISVTGVGANKGFSALITDAVPNYHLHDTGQYFPLYYYEKPELEDETVKMFAEDRCRGLCKKGSNLRYHAFPVPRAVRRCQHQQGGHFLLCLRHPALPEYKQRFASDLKRCSRASRSPRTSVPSPMQAGS